MRSRESLCVSYYFGGRETSSRDNAPLTIRHLSGTQTSRCSSRQTASNGKLEYLLASIDQRAREASIKLEFGHAAEADEKAH
jgi:hypothetical protein